jgi:hypothetical protein
VAGLPIPTFLGFLTTVTEAFLAYGAVYPAAYGALNPFYMAVTLSLFIVAPVIYAASYYYHKSKGMLLTLLFKEIPPEYPSNPASVMHALEARDSSPRVYVHPSGRDVESARLAFRGDTKRSLVSNFLLEHRVQPSLLIGCYTIYDE